MESWWIIWGLGSALGLATADVLMKRFFTGLSPYGMVLVRLGYTVPILSIGWWWTKVPDVSREFLMVVGAALPIEAAATLCYMQALKTAPLSVCAPIMAYTPLFLIVTGWLLLQEALNFWGLAGVMSIVLGSYFLNLNGRGQGWLAPWAVFRQVPGTRWMLLAAGLFAITSALGKLAVLYSAPTFFGLFYPTIFSGFMLAGYPWSSRPGIQLRRRPLWGFLMGCCMATSILCHFHGISLAPAAYLIAVKRTSLLFSVLYGGLWLQEGEFSNRLTGSGFMLLGVILITIWGN
jgi:drug/metabolite transporter (DMT)-like permease